MKALSMAVLALLGSTYVTASQHSDDCNRIRRAEHKIYYVVTQAWGANKGNAKIFNGAASQAEYDIGKAKAWAERLATITVDPQSGSPVDCGPIRDKLADFIRGYEELKPKFTDAATVCGDLANAVNGSCGKKQEEVFKARDTFISAKMGPFLTAERGGPVYCQAGFNGYLNGTSILADGRLPQPCARPAYVGGRAICADIPLNNMSNAAKDACKDQLDKIRSTELSGAKALCSAINQVKDKLLQLKTDFNKPNKIFYEAAIGAAVSRESLLNIKRLICDGGGAPPSGGPPEPPCLENQNSVPIASPPYFRCVPNGSGGGGGGGTPDHNTNQM